MSKATNDMTEIVKKLQMTVKQAVSKTAMRAVGKFAVDTIVKRTRLGYGVDEQFGPRSRLFALSEGYIDRRRGLDLDSTTRPNRSNLTNTGQMLRSMGFKVLAPGKLIIEPEGDRDDGLKNLEVAERNAESYKFPTTGYTKPARVFNRISDNEYFQILRFYRRNFTDLLKRVRL